MAWTPRGSFLAAVLLLLVSSGLHLCTPVMASPESCTCQSAAAAPLLNCSSAGLSSAPRRLRDAVAQLDLSHNLLEAMALDRPHRNLRDVRLGSNGIARLSLCVDRTLGGRIVVGRRGRRCVSWAPALQLLSVERNQLERLPQGLGGSESLQVLQLSFNRISSLRPEDLNNLRQLKELHLQHNLIASLHPQMFQDLARLQVLDLSFNLLTSLHPLMHLSLSNIGADVQLSGNRWQCDCGMRSLRRRMAYDISRGLQTWSLVCGSPSVLSGRDLLQLEDDDLNCLSAENGPELHRDVTVYSGSEILLSCSTEDSVWWTPGGQASSKQPQAGLVISDITERVTGLYVCVSEEHKVVSVFNLQISKTGGARRKSRSLPRTSQQLIPQNTPSRNERATQSDLNLAVCLSVFITFAIAFILGVLARPCIDVLWRRVTKKKSSSATISASSVEQRQYDNEAYFNGEEPENMGAHRERRVTFSTVNFREEGNSEYYNTVVGVKRVNLNNDAANGFEAAERDSVSESSFLPCSPEPNLSDITDTGNTQNMEFEPIPDPVVLVQRRNLSSCSDSSLSDKVFNKDQMIQGEQHSTPKSHQPAEDSFQQRADSTTKKVEVPQISIEGTSEFPLESFADWPPHTKNTFLSDPGLWQENGEQFEFSDSVQSTSARSSIMCSSFDDTKLIVAPTSAGQNVDDSSSSGSYVDEDEQTQYTVNSDQEEEDIRRNYNAGLKHDAGFEQQVHVIDPIRPSVRLNQGDYRYDTQRPAVRPEESFSYHSSDSDGVYTVKNGQTPENLSTELDLQHIPQIKRRVAIKRLKASDSSSSDESINEIENSTKKQEHREVDIVIKRRAPLPPPDSYSKVESADRTMDHVQKRGDTQVTRLPIGVSQTGSHDSDAQWPALDLEDTIRIKRHLDIKAPSPASDSSSISDAEDRTTRHTRPGKVAITRPQFQESQPVSQDPDRGWPAVDLEHTMRIKRHLDIKAPSADSDSSSIYESIDETTKKHEHGEVDLVQLPIKEYQSVSCDTMKPQLSAFDLDYDTPIRRRTPLPPADSCSRFESADKTVDHMQKQGDTQVTRLPIGVFQTGSHDSDTQWPALDLEDTIRIKRRLDIKAPSPASNSSSSSDSEDRTTHHTTRPGRVDIVGPQFQESQPVSQDPDRGWPAVDLEHTMRIKRHLDIKAPSADSDSSSIYESIDETTKKHEHGEVDLVQLPIKEYQSVSCDTMKPQLSAFDLDYDTPIRRRAPLPPADSCSRFESADKTVDHMQKQGDTQVTRLPIGVFQTGSHDSDTQWPALDLEDTIRIKRRLDIKAPSPASNSSSSSDSEDRTTHHTTRPGRVDIVGPQFQESQPVSQDPDRGWPAVDLEHTMRIKRHLDIKAPSADSDSSSIYESIDETTKKHEHGEVDLVQLPIKEYQSVSCDTMKPQLSAFDLDYDTPIRRRAPLPPADSYSRFESADKTVDHMQKQGDTQVTRLPIGVSQTGSHDSDTQWPALDLEDTIRIKRRLDIKAPPPASNSSSSSDSEDRTTHHTTRPGRVDIVGPQFQESETRSRDPDTSWPALDLEPTIRIKRRLDIKAPSPASNSSSSSDSEDRTTHHTTRPGRVDIVGPQFQESETRSHDPDTSWPALDLEPTMRIKRRLDIKALPASDSSSSSNSEDEATNQIKEQKHGEVSMARLPVKVSQNASQEPQTQWPALDLEDTIRIKRHLAVKAPSHDSESSSNSDTEDGTTRQTTRPGKVDFEEPQFHKSQTGSPDPDEGWPALDLDHNMRIKRRLDIKAPSPPSSGGGSTNHTVEGKKEEAIKMSPRHSSSSSDQQEEGVEDLRYPPTTVESKPHSRWPELDLKSALRVKKRLDIKAPSPPSESPSSSDHESEGWTTNLPANVEEDRRDVGISSYQPGRKLPGVNVGVPPVKRRLNIKGPSQQMDCSSNSDNESTLSSKAVKHERDKGYVGITDCGQQTKLRKSPGDHYINRRLDIKAPQPDPGLSSDSDSEDEYRDHANIGLGVSAISKATDKEFIRSPNTPVINIPHSPKTDHNIKLEKYTVVGEVGDKATRENIGITPEINPELESRWATMNLGVSRFRKRLEITSNSPPNLPSSPPPDLPSSSSSESGTGSKSSRTRRQRMGVEIHAEPSLTTETKPVNVSFSRDGNTVEITERLRKDYNLPTTEDNSNPDPHSSLANIPHIRRALDIRAPLQRETSSSSKSEDETLGHSVPDLSLGIPRVKRYLNVKALLPKPSDSPPSSSYSDNEVTRYTENQSRHASNMSGMTDDDSLITYKRLIIKTSSPPGHSFSSTGKGQTVAQEGRFNSVGDRNDVVKRRMGQPGRTTEVDLPPEIRWTGVGHQLSDLSIPSMRRHQDGGLASPPAEPELPPPDSSSSESDDDTRRIREKADKHPSLAFGRALDRFDDPPSSHNEIFKATSEDRTERKGLSALKAMSSERRNWDTLEEEGAPSLFDDRGSQGDTGFNYRRSEKDDEATQSLTRLLLSSTTVERRATDLLYDIPRYRRHDIGGIEPQQGAPPPVPVTSPPYEGVGLTPWRETQSRNTKESQNLAGYFDSTDANISEV